MTFCTLNFILHTCKICSDVQHLNLSFNSDLFHKLIMHLEIKWHQETNKRIIIMIHQWTSFSDWCAKIPAQHSGIWSICATFTVWHHQTNTCSSAFIMVLPAKSNFSMGLTSSLVCWLLKNQPVVMLRALWGNSHLTGFASWVQGEKSNFQKNKVYDRTNSSPLFLIFYRLFYFCI